MPTNKGGVGPQKGCVAKNQRVCCQKVLPKFYEGVAKIVAHLFRGCCSKVSAAVSTHSQFCSNKVVFHAGKTILFSIIRDGNFDNVCRRGPELFGNSFGNTPQLFWQRILATRPNMFGRAFWQHLPLCGGSGGYSLGLGKSVCGGLWATTFPHS